MDLLQEELTKWVGGVGLGKRYKVVLQEVGGEEVAVPRVDGGLPSRRPRGELGPLWDQLQREKQAETDNTPVRVIRRSERIADQGPVMFASL